MKQTKFSVNALLIVVLIFSIITLFFTVKLTNMADRTAINSFHPIEGTDLAVKYSSLEPDGIYKGKENQCVLVLEGRFGFDWGAVVNGDSLFINEYLSSSMGYTESNIVKISLNSYKKEVVFQKAILRGQNQSGQLVIIRDFNMPSNSPNTNRLCKLYSFAKISGMNDNHQSDVIFVNPSDNQILYTTKDIVAKNFDEKYLNSTLEEVQQCNSD